MERSSGNFNPSSTKRKFQGHICLSEQIFYTKQSLGAPIALQTERGRFFMTLSERTCMNSSDMVLLIVSSSGSSGLRGKFPWQNLTDTFYILKLF